MLILGYPRRLAVNQKEVKEVRTVAERLVTESGNIIGFVQVVGILAFGFSALLMIWSVLLIITVILYRREQNKRWKELSALLDIIDEAILVLREEDRSYLALELKRAERLVDRYNDVRRVVTLVERV